MDSELKPCPFCGKREPVEMITVERNSEYCNGYFVLCSYSNNGCGAAGAIRYTKEDATYEWNRREGDVKDGDVGG